MSAFKLHTLKQKILSILIVSGLLRLLTFLFLPKLVFTNLAPDEGMYASLAKWLGESNPVNEFPGYGDIIYRQSKAFILPASFLFRLGINELDAIRIVSSLYGFGSLVVVGLFAFKYLNVSANKQLEQKRQLLVISLVTVYAFLPSHFLWSILGLRESAVEFFTLLTFFFYYLISRTSKRKAILSGILTALSISMVFNSRPQVGWLLFASLMVTTFFVWEVKKALIMLLVITSGLILGNIANQTYSLNRTPQFALVSLEDKNVLKDEGVKLSCKAQGQVISLDGERYRCVQAESQFAISGVTNPGLVVLNNIEGITTAQTIRKSGAASEIQTFPCPFSEDSRVGKLLCIGVRAPYMSTTFLLRPILIVDTTSVTSYFAAAENLLWLLVMVLIAYGFIRFRKSIFTKQSLPALLFFISYVIGAGSYQGNLGTAFRHKSLVLWILILCTYKVTWSLVESKSRSRTRNNSQESAV
jgi:hypothetical protein